MKKKMVVERFENFDAIVPRIGRSTQERLEWIVAVVQRKEELTPGDRENLRLELAAFTWLGNPLPAWYLQRLRRHIGKVPKSHLGPVPADAIPLILERLRRNIGFVVKQTPHYPFDKNAQLWRAWDEHTGKWSAVLFRWEADWRDAAAEALDRLIAAHGHLVKECPAPAVRGKVDEICGRWFVAKRPNQDYCSATCQSRASTRAARGGIDTAAAVRRVTRAKEWKALEIEG